MSDLAIDFTLPLDHEIVSHNYQDSDGEWRSGPTTVLDVVLERAAQIVADQLLRNAGTDAMPYDLFRELVKPKVDALLAQKVDEALARKITPTGEWGQPKGDPQPLEQWIAGRIEQWLRSADAYNRKSSPLDKAVEGSTPARSIDWDDLAERSRP